MFVIFILACHTSSIDSKPLPGVTDTSLSSDTAVTDTSQTVTETAVTSTTSVAKPAFYPEGQVHSPINEFGLSVMRDIAARNADQADDVFMKVGASSTASSNTLHCFASDQVDLGDYTELADPLAYFLNGDAAGSTPFDRDTLAAISGKTASWAIDGPVQDEMAAISPRFAIIHYGTNDMGMGSTYESALYPFHEDMEALLEIVTEEGVVPILTGISPRLDSSSADEWVSTYNAAIRGIAQEWQVPFLDLQYATDHLDGYGMASDGLHLEAYSGGACILTEEGLEHGYNIRNLIALQAFGRVKDAVLGESEQGEPASVVEGAGAPMSPYRVHTLPFTDARDTSTSLYSEIDEYDCDDANESGPEIYYRIELDERTDIRALVLDQGDTDIDIHLLDEAGGCLVRDHQMIEATLDAGRYTFVLDTWVDGEGTEMSGEYLFVVLNPNE